LACGWNRKWARTAARLCDAFSAALLSVGRVGSGICRLSCALTGRRLQTAAIACRASLFECQSIGLSILTCPRPWATNSQLIMISTMGLGCCSPCVPTCRKPLNQAKGVGSFGAKGVGSFGAKGKGVGSDGGGPPSSRLLFFFAYNHIRLSTQVSGCSDGHETVQS
jgi:hypothetical protein